MHFLISVKLLLKASGREVALFYVPHLKFWCPNWHTTNSSFAKKKKGGGEGGRGQVLMNVKRGIKKALIGSPGETDGTGEKQDPSPCFQPQSPCLPPFFTDKVPSLLSLSLYSTETAEIAPIDTKDLQLTGRKPGRWGLASHRLGLAPVWCNFHPHPASVSCPTTAHPRNRAIPTARSCSRLAKTCCSEDKVQWRGSFGICSSAVCFLFYCTLIFWGCQIQADGSWLGEPVWLEGRQEGGRTKLITMAPLY